MLGVGKLEKFYFSLFPFAFGSDLYLDAAMLKS